MNNVEKWVPGAFSKTFLNLFEDDALLLFCAEEGSQFPVKNFTLNLLLKVSDLLIVGPFIVRGLDIEELESFSRWH